MGVMRRGVRCKRIAGRNTSVALNSVLEGAGEGGDEDDAQDELKFNVRWAWLELIKMNYYLALSTENMLTTMSLPKFVERFYMARMLVHNRRTQPY